MAQALALRKATVSAVAAAGINEGSKAGMDDGEERDGGKVLTAPPFGGKKKMLNKYGVAQQKLAGAPQ